MSEEWQSHSDMYETPIRAIKNLVNDDVFTMTDNDGVIVFKLKCIDGKLMRIE